MSRQDGFALTLENCVGDYGLNVNFPLDLFVGFIMIEDRPHPEVSFASEPV